MEEWRTLLNGPKDALREHFDALAEATDGVPDISRREFGSLVIHRLYHSSALTLLYIAVLLANLAILVLVLARPTTAEELWFVIAECLITAAVVNEVALRLFLLGTDYFLSVSNIFDFIVAVCCVLLVILSIHIRELSGSGGVADVELTFLLLLYRIAVSVLRAVVVVKRHYNQRQTSTEEIDFSSLPLSEEQLEWKATHDGNDGL
jgi:hypothetical protein